MPILAKEIQAQMRRTPKGRPIRGHYLLACLTPRLLFSHEADNPMRQGLGVNAAMLGQRGHYLGKFKLENTALPKSNKSPAMNC